MRKIMTALTALSLVAAPTTAAFAQASRDNGEELSDEHRLQMGHGVAFAVIGLAVLFALFLILDDDEGSESP